MEAPRYLHLLPGSDLPDLGRAEPFRAVVIAECDAADEWRARVSDWLVRGGCRYMVAWGVACDAWHVSVDLANAGMFDAGPIPDESFVMTTSHADQPLGEALWFAQMCALHPTLDLETLIVHVAPQSNEAELLAAFRAAVDE